MPTYGKAGWLLLALACAQSLRAQQTVVLPAKDQKLELRLEPLYAVGRAEGEAWQEFQQLSGAAFGPDGRLYLLDAPASVVIVVNDHGQLIRRLGSRGAGPGEFRSPNGLAAFPDGRIAVWAEDKRAFVMFDSAGATLDEIRPGYDAGLPQGPLMLCQDGTLLAFAAQLVTGSLGHAYLTGSGITRAMGELPLLRIQLATGAQVQVLARAHLPAPEKNAPVSALRAFEPEPSAGLLADGRVALFHDNGYRVDVLRPDGSLERVLTRPFRTRPTTDADRSAFMKSMAGERVHSMGSAAAAATPPKLPQPWFHPVIPPILRIAADGRSHIWVQRRDPANPTRPGPVDVLTADGHYLGTLAGVPPGLPAAWGPDGRFVFLENTDMDVPVARVYRLPPTLR